MELDVPRLVQPCLEGTQWNLGTVESHIGPLEGDGGIGWLIVNGRGFGD
jgi:hypothetical protein